MTEEQKAYIREVAFEAAQVIGDGLKDQFASQLKIHALDCPIAKEFTAQQNQAKGEQRLRKRTWALLVIVCGVVSTIITFALQSRDQIAQIFHVLFGRG